MNQTRFSKLSYVLLLFVLVACQAQATVVPTTAPIPATAVPPTAIPPTVAPTVTLTQAGMTFSSKIFKFPMSVSFGSDWHVIDDLTDLVTVQATKADWNVAFNIVTDAKVADPVSGVQIPFPEDFASWIKSNPDFKADEPTEVTVAGIKGLQIDAVPMTTKQKDFLYNRAGKWNIIPSPVGWRFIMLNDVNGERL